MPNEMACGAAGAASASPDESLPAEASRPLNRRTTASWFIKRAIIGVVILTVSIGSMAVLLHAGIDPRLDAINTNGTLLNTIVKMATRF